MAPAPIDEIFSNACVATLTESGGKKTKHLGIQERAYGQKIVNGVKCLSFIRIKTKAQKAYDCFNITLELPENMQPGTFKKILGEKTFELHERLVGRFMCNVKVRFTQNEDRLIDGIAIEAIQIQNQN